MTEITATLVKDLREKTGAGMMDCKKALAESGGDLEAAVDWLRKKGLSAAAKKAGRTAAEGLVAVVPAGTQAAIVEVNAETDFVARNEHFQAFALQVAKLALTAPDVTQLAAARLSDGATVQDALTSLIATIGENMSLRRCLSLRVTQGVVACYVHSAVAPQLGKIGVLVALESSGDATRLQELGKQIAMHIAASRPESVTVADLASSLIERERAIFAEQAATSGKPAEIIAKMVEGRLRKYYEEVVLLEQTWVLDGESKVKDIITRVAAELGAPVTVTGFVRYQLGEGIEKQQDDFAAEVARMAG